MGLLGSRSSASKTGGGRSHPPAAVVARLSTFWCWPDATVDHAPLCSLRSSLRSLFPNWVWTTAHHTDNLLTDTQFGYNERSTVKDLVKHGSMSKLPRGTNRHATIAGVVVVPELRSYLIHWGTLTNLLSFKFG